MSRFESLKTEWNAFRHSATFHNALLFVVFVVISALFWFIMALNDSVQDSFEVRFNVTNVPDSVTFIENPPHKLHVVVRDKGTSLLRNVVFKFPVVNMNFGDFSSNGVFRIGKSDIMAALKSVFGGSAQISAVSMDSLRLDYTTLKGKRVPVVVVADVSASSGNVVESQPKATPSSVLVFSNRETLDTITRVFTRRIVRRNLSETTSEVVALNPVKGARVEPSHVRVTVPVQPLVNKESMVDVTVRGVPQGMSLLLYPSKVRVSYFVPMSRFNNEDPGVEVWVDYADTQLTGTKKLPVRIGRQPAGLLNFTLKQDSVEYTIVRN